jgi:hypothetical protein
MVTFRDVDLRELGCWSMLAASCAKQIVWVMTSHRL